MPLWAKIDVDMPEDAKLYGASVVARHLWTCLICLAKKQDGQGSIRGFDCGLLAGKFNLPKKGVADALAHYQTNRMVEVEADGTIRLLNFEKRQAADSAADRQARWRDEHRNENVTRIVTDRNGARNGPTLPEVEIEKEQEKKEQRSVASASALPDPPPSDAQVVFDYWRKVMGKDSRSKLDSKRRVAIRQQFALGRTVDDLRRAIDGCRLDDFSMGKNDRATKFNDIKLICRDAEHVEKFLEIAEKNAPRVRVASPREETPEERQARVNAKFDAEIAALDGRKAGIA